MGVWQRLLPCLLYVLATATGILFGFGPRRKLHMAVACAGDGVTCGCCSLVEGVPMMSPVRSDGLCPSAPICSPWGPHFVHASLVVSCGSPCELPLVSQSSRSVGLAAFTRLVAVADALPSALGGFARAASGRSSYRCAYPNARGRCCVLGLDLARAPGVVALGSG